MRQSIGGSWVFMIVVLFTLIFASYLALTINYSRSFRVKNEVLNIIEKSQGFTDNGVKLINNYLSQAGYKTTGTCKVADNTIVYGAVDLNGTIENIRNGNHSKYYYCFSKYTGYHSYYKTRAYYRLTLFFHFDLPVIGDLMTFDVDGQTSEIDSTYDSYTLSRWS
ncbi:MAG: hypothetical protein IJ572_00135 [Bacilli bacterium]|nr:hypothetical protein [Bacilli bacterium]